MCREQLFHLPVLVLSHFKVFLEVCQLLCLQDIKCCQVAQHLLALFKLLGKRFAISTRYLKLSASVFQIEALLFQL